MKPIARGLTLALVLGLATSAAQARVTRLSFRAVDPQGATLYVRERISARAATVAW